MQPILPKLNNAAAVWFSYVGHSAWQASLLAVLLLVVVGVGRRWPSPLRYWLLVLALVKFALPPALSLPTGLFSHAGPAVDSVRGTSVRAAAMPAGAEIADPPVPFADVNATPVLNEPFAERTHAEPAPRSDVPTPDFKAWLMLSHCVGTLIVALWIAWGLLAMRRTLRRATTAPDGELWRRFVELSQRLGLRHPPRLLLSCEPCGPAAFGVLRPMVILPEAVTSLDAASLDAILAHELAHHRRRDPFVNWLQLTLGALWWFNPLLWVLNRQIRKVREDCCDDLLLARNITTGQDYCETLLSAASRLTQPAAAGISLGFGDSLHPLGRRLPRLMDQTLRRAPRLSLSGILVVGFLAAVVLPGLRQSDGDDSAPPVKQPESATVEVADEKGEPTVQTTAPSAAGDESQASTVVTEWPEGVTVSGRVVDHQGRPVANAEVLLLGAERVFVDADRRNWFVPGKQDQRPASARTDKDGAFSITRKLGAADRLGIIAKDPLFWVVSRKNLPRSGPVEIKLPASGSLAIDCDLPGKPAKVPVMIELKTFDHVAWNVDVLRFHGATFSLDNPGEKRFDHLPSGQFSVQFQHQTKTAGGTLSTGGDRQLVEIEPAKHARIRFARKQGRSLSGVVRGMEDVELREAFLTIKFPGPEEIFGNEKKPGRRYIALDVLPITSAGRFTIDPIPPGDYTAHLFAVRAVTPQLSSQRSDFSATASFTVPEEGEMPKIEIVAKANAPRDLSQVTDLRVRVVDEDGKPLPNAEVMLHTADQGYKPWATGRDGLVLLGGDFEFRDAALQLLLRADGYASTIVHFPRAQREKLTKGAATIALRRGRKVQLRFNPPAGLTWPNGTVPETYFDDLQTRVRTMWQPSNRRDRAPPDFNMLNLKEVEPGRFEFQLAEETPRFHVAVHAPGFLQFFETGPFTFADAKNDGINIDLPRPATLDISFAPGEYPDANSLFKSVSMGVLWQIQGNSYLSVASSSDDSLTPRLKLADLAPGRYLVDVRTQPQDDSKPLAGTQINLGRYHDRRLLTLKDGHVEKIDFRSSPYDRDAFRGTRTAVLRITAADSKPAQGREVSVTRYDGHYGSQVVFSGAVPESGEIMLTDITDAKLSDAHAPPYQVRIGDQYLGSFGFAQETAAERFEFSLPPGAGDMAPDVKLTNLTTGERISLSDLRGKVVFVELWATWCGPCQRPMAALNALGDEQRAAWKDRVVIVPISIDAERARVRAHVREREWTAVEQFRSDGGDGADFESPAARAFVLSSVPQSVLIGRDGRILWRGHPTNQTDGSDVKSRIERALK